MLLAGLEELCRPDVKVGFRNRWGEAGAGGDCNADLVTRDAAAVHERMRARDGLDRGLKDERNHLAAPVALQELNGNYEMAEKAVDPGRRERRNIVTDIGSELGQFGAEAAAVVGGRGGRGAKLRPSRLVRRFS